MTNKIKAVTSLCILSVVVLIGVLMSFGSKAHTQTFDFKNSDSISIGDIEGNHLTEIKGADKTFIENFCSVKNAVNGDVETPACFFDTVEIIIVKDNETYIIYPSGDDCNNLTIDYKGESYYGGMADSMVTFKSILRKNNIPWYWG